MKTKCKLNLFSTLLMSLSLIFITSCGKDDISDEPADTITLNMQNELNGKTILGESDVFINKSNNFRTSSCYITDAGQASGVGVKIRPLLKNLTQEVAVTPGHVYQIFDRAMLLDFPSGNRAVEKGVSYYQVYVVSPITNENSTTGATVKYFLTSSDEKGLPEVNHKLGDFQHTGETLEMTIPKGAECVMKERSYESVEDIFDVSTDNNKLLITLKETPNSYSGPYGTYTIYIRLGNVYTSVDMNVKD